MSEQHRLIPTNIITGFLGVGKTTSINALLANKPDGESWAVLVNEFGQVGIDQEMFPEQDGLHVKELAGGCMCCAVGANLTQTLSLLLEHAKPDRLIIEPTGLGHPEGIIDTLMGATFRGKLDLRATICLLDPRLLVKPEVISNQIFQDQLSLADVVLVNKCDLAEESLIELAETSLSNMFPPKQHVGRTTQGEVEFALLDVVRNGQLEVAFPELPAATGHQHSHDHKHEHSHPHKHITDPESLPEPGKPLRKTGDGSGFFSCGWIFHREDCFDYWALDEVLNGIEGISRIKAVIRIGHAWVLFNRVEDEHDFDQVAHRRDSRVEIISPRALDWDEIEQKMLACKKDN